MPEHTSDKTVLLALSGGVDSAVAALLLQQRGFRVVGAFMKMWSDTKDVKGECIWMSERRDAYAVGAHLGIPVMTLDFEDDYRREVMDDFFAAYERGETPNPDILCNSRIKFPLLRAEADRQNIPYIATGHYARIHVDDQGKPHLLTAVDKEKDQTYFLAGLSSKDLEKTLFPIGDFVKSDVRKIAADAGLTVSDKRSTRGICFVGKVDIPDFLRQKIADKPGDIVTVEGEKIGTHQGVHGFTIGQRHGFGSASYRPVRGSVGGSPYFVTGKDVATQTLFVSSEEKDLFRDSAALRDIHWIANAPSADMPLEARVRYRADKISVVLRGTQVHFSAPQRAVTPGQYIVFYSGEECLGTGIIEK